MQQPRLIEQHDLNNVIRVSILTVAEVEVLRYKSQEIQLLSPNEKMCAKE